MKSENSGVESMGDLTVEYLPPSQLLLDAVNPRLPTELRGQTDQDQIAITMAEIFDALGVALSIARFGFYPWEALVVIPSDNGYIVVEGNRRLTAIKGLLDEGLRGQFQDPEPWHQAAREGTAQVPSTVPCVVVKTRDQAEPALGYRHISGIKPWEPQMQARFVASLIDDGGRSYQEVAERTGKTVGWVQTTYANFKVFETAESLGVDTEGADDAYSLLTVAMGTRELREHIGAVTTISEGETPIATPNRERIAEVFEWVFGSDRSPEPVASESRQIKSLAKVIGTQVGLDAIRSGLSLEEAKQRSEDNEYDPAEIALRDLAKAEQALNRVDLTSIAVDDRLQAALDAVVEQTQRLMNEIDSEVE